MYTQNLGALVPPTYFTKTIVYFELFFSQKLFGIYLILLPYLLRNMLSCEKGGQFDLFKLFYRKIMDNHIRKSS